MNKVESAVSHLGRNPSTELELVLSAVVLQVALSFAMAASQENILSLIALVNGAVYLTWQYSFSSKRKRRLRQWMMTHFLLNWDFKHQDDRRSGLPESLVLSEFSHISQTHLAANMGTLWAFGPYAVSVLGERVRLALQRGGSGVVGRDVPVAYRRATSWREERTAQGHLSWCIRRALSCRDVCLPP